ncbi:hypothetical protein PSTG_10710 [Puccinia striiformis f. sp. tritici PST-78]|uniref:Uncharacterized protein n=1 Tax=Puccinia striiformis f. sp. tritici PST-78 TaxID=1165861 RepID=A0A0L0VAM2_9BASI|nr:hypothetical protein PSTG_10710 [Puccinia striiformis f. sp. tritici PST-78]
MDSCSPIFFTTTDINYSDNRYLGKPWEDFKARLMVVAIPSDCETEIRKQVRYLKMQDSETFIKFSTQACTLQLLLNFDTANSFGDLELAKCITFSLPRELQGKIADFRLLRQKPFD